MAWSSTPSGSSAESLVRSRRRGERRKLSTNAATHGMPDEAGDDAVAELDERVRLERRDDAVAARGQFGQPRPEPVSRTAAPLSTMQNSRTRAVRQTSSYWRGVSVGRRMLGGGQGVGRS